MSIKREYVWLLVALVIGFFIGAYWNSHNGMINLPEPLPSVTAMNPIGSSLTLTGGTAYGNY